MTVNTYIAIVLPLSTSKDMNAVELREKDVTIKTLTANYLEMCPTKHGNTAQCTQKARKVYNVAHSIPKMIKKTDGRTTII